MKYSRIDEGETPVSIKKKHPNRWRKNTRFNWQETPVSMSIRVRTVMIRSFPAPIREFFGTKLQSRYGGKNARYGFSAHIVMLCAVWEKAGDDDSTQPAELTQLCRHAARVMGEHETDVSSAARACSHDSSHVSLMLVSALATAVGSAGALAPAQQHLVRMWSCVKNAEKEEDIAHWWRPIRSSSYYYDLWSPISLTSSLSWQMLQGQQHRLLSSQHTFVHVVGYIVMVT